MDGSASHTWKTASRRFSHVATKLPSDWRMVSRRQMDSMPFAQNGEPRQLCGGILAHHSAILMFKDVTVEHEGKVGGCRLRESHKKFGRLA